MEKEKEEVNARLLDEDDYNIALTVIPTLLFSAPIAIDLCIMD